MGIVGMRGSGKTTYVRHHLQQFEPFIFFDFINDFSLQLDKYRVDNFGQLIEALENHQSKIIITPDKEQLDEIIEFLISYGKHMNRNYTLIFDEADVYFEKTLTKQQKYLINYGRHAHLSLIFISRQPKRLNHEARGQITYWVVFPLQKEDLKVIKDLTGYNYDFPKRYESGSIYFVVNDNRIKRGELIYG